MVKEKRKNTMKRKLKGFGVGLALATMLTTVANATTVYDWVPDASNPESSLTSSGTFALDSSLNLSEMVDINPIDNPSELSTFSFTLGTTTFNNFNGTITLLDGYLQLDGYSQASQSAAAWTANLASGPDENKVDFVSDPAFGDWVPEVAVPEPSTMIAAGMLLLPFGASTLRMLRRNRAA